jgi:hypothetical protein
MSGRTPWKSIVASIVVLATPSANAAEPGLTTVDPREYPVAPVPESPPVATAVGSTHVYEAFRAHVDAVQTQRIATGVSSLIIGAAAVGTGLYVENQWDEDFGTVLWIGGTVAAAGGGLTLLFETEVERIADEHGIDTTTSPSAEQEANLERAWEKAAATTRGGRQIGAFISFGLAGAALGGAAYVMAAEPVSEETEHWLLPTLFLGSAGTAAGGIVALMVEMPTEAAYKQFKATRTVKPPASFTTNFRVGAAPLPSGGGYVSVTTAF